MSYFTMYHRYQCNDANLKQFNLNFHYFIWTENKKRKEEEKGKGNDELHKFVSYLSHFNQISEIFNFIINFRNNLHHFYNIQWMCNLNMKIIFKKKSVNVLKILSLASHIWIDLFLLNK